ncbi:MAG: hypothetical protein AB7G28_23830 [Pirellulales bacterium]
MPIPACEICGNPATIHDSHVSSGAADTHHYCGQHAPHDTSPAPSLTSSERIEALATLAEYFGHLSEREKSQLTLEHRLARRSRIV